MLFAVLAAVTYLCCVQCAEVIAKLDLGFQSESIEYDATNNVFWLTDTRHQDGDGHVASITADMDKLMKGELQLINPALSNGAMPGLISGAGIVSTGKQLFVADQTAGNITTYDIAQGMAVDMIHIENTYLGQPAQLNGLCLDIDSAHPVLYVTAPGIDFPTQSYTDGQGIWAIDLESG